MQTVAHVRSALGWYIVAAIAVDVLLALLTVGGAMLVAYSATDPAVSAPLSDRVVAAWSVLTPLVLLAYLVPAWHLARAHATPAARVAILAGAALVALLAAMPLFVDPSWSARLPVERPGIDATLTGFAAMWLDIAIVAFLLLAWRRLHVAVPAVSEGSRLALTRRALGWLAVVLVPTVLTAGLLSPQLFHTPVHGHAGAATATALAAWLYLIPGWHLARAQATAGLRIAALAAACMIPLGGMLALFAGPALPAGPAPGSTPQAVAQGVAGFMAGLGMLLMLWMLWRSLRAAPAANPPVD